MCKFVLIGAQTDLSRLRHVLSSSDFELDTDIAPAPAALACFPATDAVVCITTRGCSCPLVDGLGVTGETRRDAHVAGVGYAFRRAIAAATLRFGGIRLLIYKGAASQLGEPRRTTTLGQLLRGGLEQGDSLISVRA